MENDQSRNDHIIYDQNVQNGNPTIAGTRFRVIDLVLSLENGETYINCLLYTSPSPRDRTRSRMPSSA